MLRNRRQTHAILPRVALMPYAKNVMELDLVLVYRSTSEIHTLAVVQNVYLIQIVIATKLVLIINVKIHVQEHVVSTLNVEQ